MALNLRSPFTLLSLPYKLHNPNNSTVLLLLRNNLEPSSTSLYSCNSSSFCFPAMARASTSETQNGVVNEGEKEEDEDDFLDEELIIRASSLKDADEVLELIAERKNEKGIVRCGDCCRIISAALLCNNPDLALSIFSAMRSSTFQQVSKENGFFVASLKWSRPDLNTYTTLVIGLAASLKVSDALKMVDSVSRVGLSSGEEVPFGKIIKCPTCLIAIAVAQPQQGIQVCLSRSLGVSNS